MEYRDVLQEISGKKKEYDRIISNVVLGAMRQDLSYELLNQKEGLLIIAHEPYRKRGYFVAGDEKMLVQMLKNSPSDIVFEWIYRGENILDSVMNQAGIPLYASYIRRMCTWNENPYRNPLPGKGTLLKEMYDPDCGEYAVKEDAEELYELSRSVFDANCDDVFTVKEWKNLIDRREVLVYRVKKKILACYVWRLEGSKLYSNISINFASADILYSLERRIFDEMWDSGIRVFYSWKNMKNKKAIRREEIWNKDFLKRTDFLYNAIYKS